MPIYELKCKDSGHVFEISVKEQFSMFVRCPRCGSNHIEKYCSASDTNDVMMKVVER